MNADALYKWINHEWENNIIPSLCEYIKIPCKSVHFDLNWQEHGFIEKAAQHMLSWCEKHKPAGSTCEILRLPKRTPILLLDINAYNDTSDKTVLLYGHLDKQPEMLPWRQGLAPWEPVIEEDKLYGRGGADDGYAIYAALTAINALRDQNLSHPRCVILIEASEESGSCDLSYYLEHYKNKIGRPDVVICLDSGALNYEQLCVTTSLRGNIIGILSVESLTEGVHSGYASGVVPDSFRIARQLLSRIEDEITGEIKVEALQCEIPNTRVSEAEEVAKLLGHDWASAFPLQGNAGLVSSDVVELKLNQAWRPALTITGAGGLPEPINAGNVLRPITTLKLSMRLPPLINAKEAALALEEILTKNPPYNAKISYHTEDMANGWNAPLYSDKMAKLLNTASLEFFNKPVVYLGEGGSIPFIAELHQSFPEAQFVVTGVLGPHSNAHGPNEFLHLEMAKKITSCVAYMVHNCPK